MHWKEKQPKFKHCCPCENRGKCKSCPCKRRGCTNCRNPCCQFKTTSTNEEPARYHPYASQSIRNSSRGNIPSRNEVLEAAASPENRQDIETLSTLRETISEMNEQTLRQVLIRAVEAEPDLMKSFIEGSRQDNNPSSEIAWCSCGRCQAFDDPRMNLCCCQSPCIASKPEFRNLCLRHDVLEIANILNWSYRTNLEPSFAQSTFRNQAYRNFVLWQHSTLGAGRRVPVPSCVCVAIRRRFPQANGQYRGYHSANSDSE